MTLDPPGDEMAVSQRDLYFGCFSDVGRWGGARAFANRLIAASGQRGLSTLLLGVGSTAKETEPGPSGVSELNVSLPAAPLLWRVRSWRAIGQLRGHLRRLQPPRKAFVGLSMYWVVAAKRAWPHVPVVYKVPCLLHNCLPCTWPQRRLPTFWKRVELAGIRRAEHAAFKLADLVLVPTESARAEVLAFHPRARERVVVCGYGPEPRDVAERSRQALRRELGFGEDALVFLAAGVCDLNKAFDWAIHELPAVDERGQLVIVGDGPERERLAQLAAELGVARRVRFVGSQQDMEPWYAAADCVLSTSRYDMFPNTIQEGMCRGRPVVVPRHEPPDVFAGMAEVVEAAGGGLVYERGRPDALAECLNQLVSNPALRDALGRQARSVAERRCQWGMVLDRILDVGVQRCSIRARNASEGFTSAVPTGSNPPLALRARSLTRDRAAARSIRRECADSAAKPAGTTASSETHSK